ncbi:MAG TPA: ABC-2 family transporter protein [Bacilli bacterium]|nr:ABC-2 family transporter protein [Bacilli bacterium]
MSLFWTFSRQFFYQQSAYRLNFWLEMFSLLLQLYVVYTLWNVLFDQAPQSFGGVSLTQMITYALLGILLGSILTLDEGVHTYIQTQVRMGMITSDLMKPIDFLLHMMARNFGTMVVRLCFYLLPPLLVAYFLFDLVLPTSLTQLLAFVLAVMQSWLILFFCNFLFGLIAFKTLDLLGFMFTYFALIRFASGQIIPLWLYPDSIRPFLDALPFQSIFYTPQAIFTGVLQGADMWQAVGVQTLWMLGLFLVARLIWGRIFKYLVVQGG